MDIFKNIHNWVNTGLLVLLFILVLVGGYQSGPGAAGTGETHYQTENFLQGLFAGTGGQFSISNLGVIKTTGDFNASGTPTFEVTSTFRQAIQLENCATAEYTLTALAGNGHTGTTTTNIASTTVTLSGVPTDGVMLVSFATTSVDDVNVTARTSAANEATVWFTNSSPTALLALTSSATISVCFFDPI